MKNKNLIRFVQSLVLLPVMTSSFSLGDLQNTKTADNILAKINIETEGASAVNPAKDSEVLTRETRAQAIDAYFKERQMPLSGHGMGMVLAAEKYDLDYRLLAAIATRETTGGQQACPVTYSRTGDMGYRYNVFGWGSCKIKFQSYEDGFEVLARNLSGNNPNTAFHYADKDTKGILQAYNPPSIVPRYAEQVMNIMNTIGPANLGTVEGLAQS
ncbi:MAG: hypothetical protein M3M85_03580 [bacterium]|nr:hypothetical protein [bacterium]